MGPETIQWSSIVTCPSCGEQRTHQMPADFCQIVYRCPACGAVARPKAGDCCIFCSYGSVRCPPEQLAGR
ncbi:MAG: GDCCVxC domain-containing (seleno)protein [Anaerolineales bacterium]